MIIVNTLIASCILSAVVAVAISTVTLCARVLVMRKAHQREIARASEQAASEWDVYPWRESDDELKQATVEALAAMSPEQINDAVKTLVSCGVDEGVVSRMARRESNP